MKKSGKPTHREIWSEEAISQNRLAADLGVTVTLCALTSNVGRIISMLEQLEHRVRALEKERGK